MGSWISIQGGMSEEERKRRQNLEKLLHDMKYSLNVPLLTMKQLRITDKLIPTFSTRLTLQEC